MASKKKTYAQGEMRPLSALAKQGGSSPKKRNTPTRVPEPPKFPQYGAAASGGINNNASITENSLKQHDLNNNINSNDINDQEVYTDVSENAFVDVFKNVSEIDNTYSEISESKPELKLEPKTELKLEQKTELKPDPKPELKLEQEPELKPDSKSESKPEHEHSSIIRSVSKSLAEYDQNVKAAVPARRRGASAPDLSNKSERDAFFSKYTRVSEKKKPVRFPEITEDYIKKQEPLQKPKENPATKRSNPFLKEKSARTVISHAKEYAGSTQSGAETEKDSLQEIQEILQRNIKEPVNIYLDKPTAKNTENNYNSNKNSHAGVQMDSQKAVVEETAPPEMRENIEGAIKLQRKEREEAKARLSADAITDIQKKSSIIRAAGVMGAIAACGLFLLFGERSTFSSEENRMLATMPEFSWSSYLNGEYTSGVSNFYNDTVPMRSTFKRAISSMQNWKGMPSDNEENAAFFGNVSVREQEDKTAQVPTEATNVTDAEAILNYTTSAETTGPAVTTEIEEYEPPVECGDSIIIYKKRAISFYGGLDSIAESYANTLNDFKKELPDVNVYSLIAPTSVSFYLPDEYNNYTASEKEKIDHANSCLKSVTPVDAYSVLEQHKDEAIYARTDHHWLPLGAYYAAEEFAKTAGVPFTDISDMDSETKEGYVGSMYTYTQSTILSENPEDFTYYKPRNTYRTEYYTANFELDYEGDLLVDITDFDPVAYYLVFMLGDDKIVHVSTDVKNDRTLVIFKDSYGNAMVPCLVGSFTDIYVCDIRYFNLNAAQFCKDVGATDLLFAMNTFSATGGNEECIEQILYYQ